MKKPFFDDFRELNSRTTGYRTAKADRFFIYLPQSVEKAGVKREQNTGFFEIEGQKEDEGGGNKADGSPATSV